MLRRPTLAALAVCLAVPGGASASGDALLTDCALDEQLSGTYSQADYRDALDTMSADVRQYTSCDAIIRQAQLASARGSAPNRPGAGIGGGVPGRPNGSSPGPTGAETLAKATPDQQRQVVEAARVAPAPVSLPGTASLDPAAAASVPGVVAITKLPTPLAVLVVCLFVAGACLGANGLRSRVRPGA